MPATQEGFEGTSKNDRVNGWLQSINVKPARLVLAASLPGKRRHLCCPPSDRDVAAAAGRMGWSTGHDAVACLPTCTTVRGKPSSTKPVRHSGRLMFSSIRPTTISSVTSAPAGGAARAGAVRQQASEGCSASRAVQLPCVLAWAQEWGRAVVRGKRALTNPSFKEGARHVGSHKLIYLAPCLRQIHHSACSQYGHASCMFDVDELPHRCLNNKSGGPTVGVATGGAVILLCSHGTRLLLWKQLQQTATPPQHAFSQ